MLNLGLTVLLILVIIPGGVVGATDIDIETTLKGIWAAVVGRVPVRWGGSPLLIAWIWEARALEVEDGGVKQFVFQGASRGDPGPGEISRGVDGGARPEGRPGR